jgi:hypothetical protein
MIRVVRSSVGYIIQHLLAVQPEPLSDGQHSYRSKGSFGVDVEALSFATSHRDRELAGDGERVTYLGLAGTEFTWCRERTSTAVRFLNEITFHA